MSQATTVWKTREASWLSTMRDILTRSRSSSSQLAPKPGSTKGLLPTCVTRCVHAMIAHGDFIFSAYMAIFVSHCTPSATSSEALVTSSCGDDGMRIDSRQQPAAEHDYRLARKEVAFSPVFRPCQPGIPTSQPRDYLGQSNQPPVHSPFAMSPTRASTRATAVASAGQALNIAAPATAASSVPGKNQPSPFSPPKSVASGQRLALSAASPTAISPGIAQAAPGGRRC